ncbi:MAG TPA: ATP-binding cassette domain-containing protein [Pedococcus sp.]|jgi:putative ABC transport system ATP-binding protein|nr:ATP-binding cassette domain-containing protein [Pedococcus sp.]
MRHAPTLTGLDARELYRFYRAGEEETLALKGVSLRVEPGEIVAVVGPSGSGKSTLLACLAGIDEPAGGTVHVAGQRLTHRPEAHRARLRAQFIGVLLQSRNLIGHLTVAQNVSLARTASPRRTTKDVLDSVGLTRRRDALPHQLSGGELARAGLAVALANDPSVLLADEPTGELDGATEQQILGLLQAHAAEGTAVLVLTHSTAVTSGADRTVHLTDGTLT